MRRLESMWVRLSLLWPKHHNMMKRLILILLFFLLLTFPAYAALQLVTDHRPLFFGLMHLGEEKELSAFGSYHNQITCSSTDGSTWYLKISLLQPLTFGMEQIPLENFKWQMVWTNGTGTSPNASRYKPFSLAADLVYISGPNEAGGNSINFQFKYSLKIPDTQVNGVYYATVRFTLTEAL